MQGLRTLLGVVAVLAVCGVVPTVHANVLLGSNVWESGPADGEGWTAGDLYADLSSPTAGGNLGGYLQLDYRGGRGGAQAATGVYPAATNMFSGAWTTRMWVPVDFWATNMAAASMDVGFQSSTNRQSWSFTNLVSSTPGDGWTDYSVVFNYSASVYGDGTGGGSVELFLSDLATIDWIGICSFEKGADGHSYELENFQLMIPEPAGYALACSALVVTCLSVRRRKKRVVGTD